jgi:hypothetical protein
MIKNTIEQAKAKARISFVAYLMLDALAMSEEIADQCVLSQSAHRAMCGTIWFLLHCEEVLP